MYKLPRFILDLFTTNADRIVKQIAENPQRLAAILGVAVLKTVSKKVIQTLVCRKVDKQDFSPDDGGSDPAKDDFNEADEAENQFNEDLESAEFILESGGDLAAAGAAAAGAAVSADTADELFVGIIAAFGSILSFFGIGSYFMQKEEAEKRQKRVKTKLKQLKHKIEDALDIKERPQSKFTPPNTLVVSWKALQDKGGQYHLKVTATLLPPNGGSNTKPTLIHDSTISENHKEIKDDKLFDAVDISVTVYATLTASNGGHTSTFNGKSYTYEVPNVHPTLLPPAEVTVTFSHKSLQIITSSSPVQHASAYNFELVEGKHEPYKKLAFCVHKPSHDSKEIQCTFDHSEIPQMSTGPFKIRCQAVGKSGSSIAASAFTYSSPLLLASSPQDFKITLPHFKQPKQGIELSWNLPESTENISGFLCQILHNDTVLVSDEVKKPTTEKNHPPPVLPTSYSFTLESLVLALNHNHIPASATLQMKARVSTLGNSNAIINSVFAATNINSLNSPKEVDFEFSATDNKLKISWEFSQETDLYGIQIFSVAPVALLYSKLVTVNKDDAEPHVPKVGYNVPCKNISAVNDPKINYTVQLTAVADGNEELDSLTPTQAPNFLRVLEPPTLISLEFNASDANVAAQFKTVPNATGYLLQLFSGTCTAPSAKAVVKPDTKSHPDTIDGTINLKSIFDELKGGDLVHGTVQALGGGEDLSSSIAKFPNSFTVLDSPKDVTYSYSPESETITLTCSPVEEVNEYLVGFMDLKGSVTVSTLCKTSDKVISGTILSDALWKTRIEEWKAFGQSVGDATHLSSPRSFFKDIVYVLPKPTIQTVKFLDVTYSVLSMTWPAVAHAVEYSVKALALRNDSTLVSFTVQVPSSSEHQVDANIEIKKHVSDWETILSTLTSLSVSVAAIGNNYYISSSFCDSSSIERFQPPQDLKYGYVTDSDTVSISCQTSSSISKCTLGLVNIENPNVVVSGPTAEHKCTFSVSLTRSEIRNKHAGNAWKVFAESAGDLTNFPSTAVTIPSPVSVLSPPVIESFTYNAVNQTLDLKWSEIQDATSFHIKVCYEGIDGEENSFETSSSPDTTSLTIEMKQEVENWPTIFTKVSSIASTITAIGGGYYISSSTQKSPTLQRLNSPESLTITSDNINVTINWSAVSFADGYTVVLSVSGKQFMSKAVKETDLVVSENVFSQTTAVNLKIVAEVTAYSDGSHLPSVPSTTTAAVFVQKIQKSEQFGGEGGTPFNDPVETHVPAVIGIKGIQISYGSYWGRIFSLQVTQILECGSTYVSPMHGSVGVYQSHIELEEGEEIIKVYGYYGRNYGIKDLVTLTELNFVTKTASGTQKVHGPFGYHYSNGIAFEFSGRVLGVFGRSGACIDALGFYHISGTTKVPMPKATECFGGIGGHAFSDDVSAHLPRITGVKAIRIRHGNQIDSIQATYSVADGSTWAAPMHGGSGGSETLIELADDETITRIEGKTNYVLVDQLTFFTHKSDGLERKYGPFGKTGQTPFAVEGKVLGFFGRSGSMLDAIGFIYL